MVLFFLTDTGPSPTASLRGDILYQHCWHVPWLSPVSLTEDMSSRTSRQLKALRRAMLITFGILLGFHFSFFNVLLGDGKCCSGFGQKGPQRERKVTHKPWRHRQIHAEKKKKKTQKKTQTKMPLKCCFVSLAVAYFTAEEFEVLRFLGVLQEQQSWDTSF